MIAVIQRVLDHPSPALTIVGDQPLVARQLEWLMTEGCSRVIVELDPSKDGAVGRWLLEHVGDSSHVDIVWSERPLGAREAATMVGVPESYPVLGLPADMLACTSIEQLYARANRYGSIAYL